MLFFGHDHDGRCHIRGRQAGSSATLPLPEHAHVRVTIDSDLEREAWLNLSAESLKKAWEDPAADIFNELLQK
jgi:hypothetical protein